MIKIILPIIFLCATSYAGRPVYKELTMSEVIGKATWVLVVKDLSVKKIKLDCGWDSEIYNVEIVEILKPSVKSELKSGQKIEFNPHPTMTVDCELRAKNPSGASFAAQKYKSNLDMSKLKSSMKFVVFLTGKKDQLELAADHAIESMEKVYEHFQPKEDQALDKGNLGDVEMIEVGLDWRGTINDFCSKNLKASRPIGGIRCDGVRLKFEKDYGRHLLRPCGSADETSVQWKAVGCH